MIQRKKLQSLQKIISKPEITHEYKNPRLITRGVEYNAILESVDSQQKDSHGSHEGVNLDSNKSVANQQQ